MMSMTQDIHDVLKVSARRYMPDNGNAVTIDIETAEGTLSQTLYFGRDTYSAGKAAAFFYALGGTPEMVVRSHDVK